MTGYKENVWCVMIYQNICNVQSNNLMCISIEREGRKRGGGGREKEREIHVDRQTDRLAGRHSERQTDRQPGIERQSGREREREREKERERERERGGRVCLVGWLVGWFLNNLVTY